MSVEIPFPSSRIPAVNVSTVPQRSPLRYPGGKTWLVPHIREWLARTEPAVLVEPFAGGGIVSLTAVMEELVDRCIMIEIDHDVAAFWHVVLRDGTTLAERLVAIEKHADKITFCEADGMQLLEPLIHGWGRSAAVFLDPPYTAGGKRAGARLYAHNDIDHAGLFETIARRSSNFLMTYDCAPEIVDLVRRHRFHAVSVQMKNAHHNHLSELVITREPLFS